VTNMEYLVEFDVKDPERAEASAARGLAEQGDQARVWRREGKVLAPHHADSRRGLDRLLGALPPDDWMQVAVTPLETRPNDPAAASD
jgi:muconolactone delta-isomerase